MSDYIASDLSATDKDCWATPQWLFDALNQEFDFDIDVAANAKNAKCKKYFTEQENALDMIDWRSHLSKSTKLSAWCNPPYSRGMIAKFMEKAKEQAWQNNMTVVLLVPATPDAGWWPEHASEIRFITNGRVNFVNPASGKTQQGNTKGSALIIFSPCGGDFPTAIKMISRKKLKDKAKLTEAA